MVHLDENDELREEEELESDPLNEIFGEGDDSCNVVVGGKGSYVREEDDSSNAEEPDKNSLQKDVS